MQDVKLTNAYKIKIIFLCKLYFLISTISNWKRDFTCWWSNFPILLSHSLPFLHPLLYSFHWSAFPSYWKTRPTSFHFPSIIPMFSPSDYRTLHHYLLIGNLNDSLDISLRISLILIIIIQFYIMHCCCAALTSAAILFHLSAFSRWLVYVKRAVSKATCNQ